MLRLERIFENVAIMPVQMLAGPAAHPVRVLYAALLERTMKDWQLACSAPNTVRGRRLTVDVIEWLDGTVNARVPFAIVCQELHLDPEETRACILGGGCA